MELEFSLSQATTEDCNLLIRAARSFKELDVVIQHIGTP